MKNELFFDSEDLSLSSSHCLPSGHKTVKQIFDITSKPPMEQESLNYAKLNSDKNKNELSAIHQLSWSTILAKIVMGYKNGETIGRVGVALLKNSENIYRIIVYKTKSNLLATYTIQNGKNAPHMHRQNSYWQFYDDNGIYWSLLFERPPDETDFINKLKDSNIRVELDVDLNVVANSTTKHDEKHVKLHCPNDQSDRSSIDKDDDADTLLGEQDKRSNMDECSRLLFRLPKIGGQQLPTLRERNSIGIVGTNNGIIDSTSLTIVGQSFPGSSEIHTQYVLPMGKSSAVAATSSTVFNPAEKQLVHMMLVENRTQNAEIRLNIDKLEMKIEKVIDKINLLHDSDEHSEGFYKLEEKILALKMENRKLKRDNGNFNGRNENTLEHIYRIYSVDLANLGIDFDPLNSRDIEGLIGDLIDKTCNFQTQLQEKESQLKNLSIALKDQKERNQNAKKTNLKLADEIDQANRKIETLQRSLDRKKETETHLNGRINDLKTQHAANLNNIKVEMTETLKEIMNTLYHNLAQSIVSMDKLLPDRILALIGKTIRQDTMSAVAKIKK